MCTLIHVHIFIVFVQYAKTKAKFARRSVWSSLVDLILSQNNQYIYDVLFSELVAC